MRLRRVAVKFTAGCFAALVAFSTLHAADDRAADETDKPAAEESWQAIFIGKDRVGYAHIQYDEIERDGRKVLVCDNLNQMTIKRFGVALHMSVLQASEEDPEGNLLSFKFNVDNPPISKVESRGEVRDGQLIITTVSAGREKQSTKPWDADVKSPAWIERILEKEPLKEGDSRKFKMFDPQFLTAATVTITHRGKEETDLLDGSRKEFEKIETRHSLVPGLVIASYVDETGETVKTVTNLMDMVTYTVSKDEALKEISAGEVDLGMNTVIHTGEIPNAHQASKAVYKVTVEGRAKGVLPEGPTQGVKPLSDTELELTVTSIKPGERGDEPAPGEEFLASSRFLDLDDPKVQALAKEGAGDLTDPVELAVALERFVHTRLVDKNFSTALATASEVARDLSGDCTEHAVLLAALLREKKIPSRVVIGFVYAKSIEGFGGHMWTEAYLNGRWVPLDATLGLGGIGVGHIKVADADLSENSAAPVAAFVPIIQLLGKTKVDVERIQ